MLVLKKSWEIWLFMGIKSSSETDMHKWKGRVQALPFLYFVQCMNQRIISLFLADKTKNSKVRTAVGF